MAVLMPVLGVGAGFLIVPLNAILQWRSPEDRRGAVIALSIRTIRSYAAGGEIRRCSATSAMLGEPLCRLM